MTIGAGTVVLGKLLGGSGMTSNACNDTLKLGRTPDGVCNCFSR